MGNELLIDSEFRSLIPPLAPEELSLLEESILEEGVRDALVLWNGYIVDGHNRYDIITKHDIKSYRVIQKKFLDKEAAKIWIMKNQVGRRNVPTYLRAEYIFQIQDWEQKKRDAQNNIKAHQFGNDTACMNSYKPVDTKKELAEILRIGEQTASRIIQIYEKAPEPLKERLRKGETTINQAYVTIHREEVRQSFKSTDWPTGKFRVIYADPPWQYDNRNPPGRFVEQGDYYPTLTIEQICALPVPDMAINNSVLFLWCTSPVLEQAFEVIRAWGFEYKASFVWDKVKHVMGHYNSVRHEFLLVATKGKCQPEVLKLFDSVQVIERNGPHSRKPPLFREIIDTIYPSGPRVELFATEKIKGWDYYGGQTNLP